LSHAESRRNFIHPRFGHLAPGVSPDISRSHFHGSAELRSKFLGGGVQVLFGNADTLAVERIEPARVFDQRAVAALAHRFENRANYGFGFAEPRGFSGQEPAHLIALKDSDHSTILFKGYSTMP
jgi:hypothetical protein